MSGSRYLRYLLEEGHVLRMVAELIVADQRSIRGAAERAIFFFIHFLEECRLVKFYGSLEILKKVLLVDAHYTDLKHRTRFAIHHQLMKTAP